MHVSFIEFSLNLICFQIMYYSDRGHKLVIKSLDMLNWARVSE